jgi:hypothetical protein
LSFPRGMLDSDFSHKIISHDKQEVLHINMSKWLQSLM